MGTRTTRWAGARHDNDDDWGLEPTKDSDWTWISAPPLHSRLRAGIRLMVQALGAMRAALPKKRDRFEERECESDAASPAAAPARGDDNSACSDTDVKSLSSEECSRRFLHYLIELKLGGTLNAKSGKFSAKFDRDTGLREHMEQSWYVLDLPQHSKGSLGEIAALPRSDARLREWVESAQRPPCYETHPVVSDVPPNTVWPLAIYLDGVGSIKRDSVLGIWVLNLVSMWRHLIAAIPKRDMCRCSCRHWCTLWPVLAFL